METHSGTTTGPHQASMALSASADGSETALIEQCGAHIGEDTVASSESVPALRFQKNTLAHLPVEILADIFMYIVSEEESYMGVSNPGGAPTCLAVTHVCRHWRQTALGCSTLWAFIDGVSAQCLAIMLERSKKAVLVVIYNDPKPLRQCGFEKILLQLPRIKFLQLCPSPPEADRILNCLSSLPAPLLHTFKFVVFGNATFAKPISDTIFQGSHLVLPVDVRVVLSLTKIESAQSFADLFSAIHKNHDESVPVIWSVRVSLLHDLFTLRFSTSIPEHPWGPRDSHIRLSIAFLHNSWITKPDMLFDICRMVPYRKIQHLVVSFPDMDTTEEFWRTGSVDLPELESIHLDDTPIQGLLLALLVRSEQSHAAYSSLRVLELENINLGCKERLFFEQVLTVLRAGRGVGIHTLRLTKCRNLMCDNVERLQTTVFVNWDRHEDALTDTDGGCLCHSCNVNDSE